MDGQQNCRQPWICQMPAKHHSLIGTSANNLWALRQPDDGYKVVVEIVDGKVNLDDDLVEDDEDFASKIDGMNVALKDWWKKLA
jgi:hypothetical protein